MNGTVFHVTATTHMRLNTNESTTIVSKEEKCQQLLTTLNDNRVRKVSVALVLGARTRMPMAAVVASSKSSYANERQVRQENVKLVLHWSSCSVCNTCKKTVTVCD